jgi:putative flippase GtrA
VTAGSQLSVPSSQESHVWRWVKFNLVGAAGIAVQLGALVVFRSVVGMSTLAATALAVETAVLHNFWWHERYTWRDRPTTGLRDRAARLLKFNMTNGAVSLVGNVAIMRVLVGGLGMNYVAANLVAVAACSLMNFLLSDRWVFMG